MASKLSRLKLALLITHLLVPYAKSDTVEVTLSEGELWRAKCGEGNDPADLARIKWSKDNRIMHDELRDDFEHISIHVNETLAKSVLEQRADLSPPERLLLELAELLGTTPRRGEQ